ncbi:hypothetical protein [Isoptericola sp. NPDC057191]|uniref:hypothetical protein n=1 Tax=Isoptericola sp. NPDC057191 TaxID=3346041 RepID=UPI0036287A5A
MRILTALVMTAAAGLTLAACTTANQTEARPLDYFLGRTLDVAWGDLSTEGDIEVREIDMTARFGGEPSFGDDGRGQEAYGEWTVLALCADATTVADAHAVEFGIIPTTLATTEVVRDAEAGRYDHDITCLGLTHRPA